MLVDIVFKGLREIWSDEARAAAIEARSAGGGRFEKKGGRGRGGGGKSVVGGSIGAGRAGGGSGGGGFTFGERGKLDAKAFARIRQGNLSVAQRVRVGKRDEGKILSRERSRLKGGTRSQRINRLQSGLTSLRREQRASFNVKSLGGSRSKSSRIETRIKRVERLLNRELNPKTSRATATRVTNFLRSLLAEANTTGGISSVAFIHAPSRRPRKRKKRLV